MYVITYIKNIHRKKNNNSAMWAYRDRKLKHAFNKYWELHGDDKDVSPDFVVPKSDDWPEDLWGLKLGEEGHSRLLMTDTSQYELVSRACKKHKELHGRDTPIPLDFVVPSSDTKWPEEMWGMELGKMNNTSYWEKEYPALGYQFAEYWRQDRAHHEENWQHQDLCNEFRRSRSPEDALAVIVGSADPKGVALLHERWDYKKADVLPRLSRFFTLINAAVEAELPLSHALPLTEVDGMLNKMEKRINKHTKKGTKDRKAWRDDKKAEKEEQKRRAQETIQSFIDKDPKRPFDQTMLQRLKLMREVRGLYKDLNPDWSGQNKLYELNRDRNLLRKQLYEHYNPGKEFDIGRVKLPAGVAGSKKHNTWIKLHGNAADMKDEIKSLTKLWESRKEIDAAKIKRVNCRGKYFNYCDVCHGKGKPQFGQCGVLIRWCDEKKEFRVHCIEKRGTDPKEKANVRKRKRGVQIRWCDEKKEFRVHCIEKRGTDPKEKAKVRKRKRLVDQGGSSTSNNKRPKTTSTPDIPVGQFSQVFEDELLTMPLDGGLENANIDALGLSI
jgi:hypothetical protein